MVICIWQTASDIVLHIVVTLAIENIIKNILFDGDKFFIQTNPSIINVNLSCFGTLCSAKLIKKLLKIK